MSLGYGQRKLGNVSKSAEDQRLEDSISGTRSVKTGSGSDLKVGEIKDYLINYGIDSTHVDTSLTIQKEYKFNYLRTDEFGLIPFANVGQTYNRLTPLNRDASPLPLFGARSRHFNYMEVGDISYYEVPSPLTELFFKTVFQQGQILDAFFTVNTSKQFNMSIAYKGLRSLGNYQNALTSTGNLRMTSNYESKNSRYRIWAHATWQDLLNEENGGLTDEEVEIFKSGDEDFLDRAVFDMQFQDAESILEGRRFFLQQEYAVIKATDSTLNNLKVKNRISFEDKDFLFEQTNRNDFFGESFSTQIRDKVSLQNFRTDLGIAFTSKLGNIYGGVSYNNFNYGYNFATIINNQIIPNRITGNTLGIDGNYQNKIGPIDVDARFQTVFLGEFEGYTFRGSGRYTIKDLASIEFGFISQSTVPNYNTLLNQSSYLNYNWYNFGNFSNENSQQFNISFISDKILDATARYRTIDNYTFFAFSDLENGVKPLQANTSVSHFEVDLDKKIEVGKFSLDNKIRFQKVVNGEGVLNIPDLIVRNSLYYSNGFFKKDALFLQTGIVFNYFTEYFADAYDPVLAEFYTQNEDKIGNFPRIDFFINAKIRQTRIFLKAEHLNSAFTGYNYFSAPNYPYRDFNIRFGLIWNFFL